MRNAIVLRIALTVAVTVSIFSAVPTRAQDGAWSSIQGGTISRCSHSVFFDRDRQRFLTFGGGTQIAPPNDLRNDTWVLDVSGTPTWTELLITGAVPGERHSAQFGYDAARNRILIFGGYGRHYPGDPFAYLDDVWELSLNGTPRWTELFPSGHTPAGRLAGAAVYDPMRQRFVGFGGTNGMPVDTWVLNLQGQANWQPLPVDGNRPNGGYGMTSVYDAAQDRMLIFGGSTSDSYYGATNDVWELKLRGVPQWTKIVPVGVLPAPRRSGGAVFDPLRNRMVIFGGWDAVPGSERYLADTWALDFDSDPPVWAQLSPTGTVPGVRAAVPAAYDPLHDQMIVFGGWNGTNYLADTQFLHWGGVSAEAKMSASGSANPAAAHVEWEVQDATGSHAAVYRRTSGGAWTAVAEAEVDATGQMTYDDTNVSPGSEYDYMMVVGSQRGETFGGEASLQVPGPLDVETSGLSFALQRVAPNPVAEEMTVSLVLPSSDLATLELVDVAGRRWLDREVGGLGAGMHRVDLAAEQVPAGLYFLRLVQGSRVATARVVKLGAR
jgi:hypothetical protein